MENEKKCFKCGEAKPLSAFYRHSQMADGHVNKCKDCNKADVRLNRKLRVDYYREYDKKRGSRQLCSYTEEYRKRYPNKVKAHRMVNYHTRAGNLVRQACEVCRSNESIHAHHDDYLQPMNVRWLCAAHHSQWHKKHGEAANP